MFLNLLCHMCMKYLLYILMMFDEWFNKCYVPCIVALNCKTIHLFLGWKRNYFGLFITWVSSKCIYNFSDTNELVNCNNDGPKIWWVSMWTFLHILPSYWCQDHYEIVKNGPNFLHDFFSMIFHFNLPILSMYPLYKLKAHQVLNPWPCTSITHTPIFIHMLFSTL
jgi:hypothetical protein